jgi:predicted methyltransferase
MKKLLTAAVATSRAHRDAVRLLLEGVDDVLHDEDDGPVADLHAFFADFMNHDTLSEVHAYTSAADQLLHFVLSVAAATIVDEASSKPQAERVRLIKRYAGIAEESRVRASETCPCRACHAVRISATKQVTECMRRLREAQDKQDKPLTPDDRNRACDEDL